MQDGGPAAWAPLRSRRSVTLALAGLAAILGVLAHLDALANPFVYDDHLNILGNPSIRSLFNGPAVLLGNVARPLVNVSYAIDYAVWGFAPYGYHLTSLGLHVTSIVLFFSLVLALARDRFDAAPADALSAARPTIAAFSAAALFAIHPLMTQAVGYVSGRADVLCALFFLAAILALRRWWLGRGARWLVAGLAAWAAALASKETAAMLPFVLLAYDRLLLRGQSEEAHGRLSRLHVPLLAAVAVLAALRLALLVFVESGAPARFVWGNVFVAIGGLRSYISMLVIPARQSIFHTADRVSTLADRLAWFNLLWALALCVLAWKMRRREPLVTVGAAWMILLLVPAGVLLAFDIGEPIAEQRVYLASLGYFLFAGVAFAHILAWPFRGGRVVRVLSGVAAALVLMSYGAATRARAEVWNDPVRLWQEAVANAPDIWVPYRGLGDALREKGDLAGAVQAYRDAVRRLPEPRTYAALGTALLALGRGDEADEAYAASARIEPNQTEAYIGRALVARLSGRIGEARRYLRRALAEDPQNAVARLTWAETLEAEGDAAAALRLCREVHSSAPETPGVGECIRRNEAKAAEPAPSAGAK